MTSDLLGQEVDSHWIFGGVGPQLNLSQHLQGRAREVNKRENGWRERDGASKKDRRRREKPRQQNAKQMFPAETAAAKFVWIWRLNETNLVRN